MLVTLGGVGACSSPSGEFSRTLFSPVPFATSRFFVSPARLESASIITFAPSVSPSTNIRWNEPVSDTTKRPRPVSSTQSSMTAPTLLADSIDDSEFPCDSVSVHEKGLEPSRLSAPEPKDVGHEANECERKHFDTLRSLVGFGCRPLATSAGHSPAIHRDCRSGLAATANGSRVSDSIPLRSPGPSARERCQTLVRRASSNRAIHVRSIFGSFRRRQRNRPNEVPCPGGRPPIERTKHDTGEQVHSIKVNGRVRRIMLSCNHADGTQACGTERTDQRWPRDGRKIAPLGTARRWPITAYACR